MTDLSAKQRKLLAERSGYQCEAMEDRHGRGIYARCWGTPVEAHHLLTKARGGRNLDLMDEIYHLIHLCRKHHSLADGEEAYEGGLLIEGYVTWEKNSRRPVYVGPDLYLTERYGSNHALRN